MTNNKIIKISIILNAILIFIFSILLISKHQQNQVHIFSVKEYEQEITEFSTEKILGYTKKMGEITNSEIAKEYAEQIWCEVYGENVKTNKPYNVYWDNNNNACLVTGTLKKYMTGGTPYIIFSKNDGKIIAIWHTK